MKAVDTNVLVRYFADDHKSQARAAARIFEAEAVFIAKSVLLETEWVLRVAYRLPAGEIAAIFDGLTQAREIHLEDEPAVRRAVAWFRQGMDFADALHVASRRGEIGFLTFDRRLVAAARRAGIAAVGVPS